MMKSFAAVLSAVILSACASLQSDSGKGSARVNIVEPEMRIQQLSSVPAAAQHIEGGLPVRYALAVHNHAQQPITLKQVSVVSMGYGAYDVPSTSRPFKTLIQPDQIGVVDFWVSSHIQQTSLVGANGPVTLRVTAFFDSPDGQFQNIVVQQVNASAGVDGSNQ
ncbi:MAG: hypothetical protein NVSMB68_16200 [Thermoanaerobaculia bacterium]